ncbi:MAG: LD-carboxypeptidase [Bythopirellula sp.]|nr:LD-carboxypeptidase [Bythopirellula sp.]
MKTLIPAALYRGDTIAIIAPASVPDQEKIERAISRLEEMGFRVKVYGDLYRRWGYLAGDDETRAEELMQAVADPEVAAIFPARGGTGVTRLLDVLDYSLFRKHPKILVGFSDITALHAALQQQAGWVTFHSPHPMDGLGMPEGLSELSARTFWRAVLAESYADRKQSGYEVPLTDTEREKIVTLAPGKVQGKLVGGNLALVCAVLGTPYEFDMTGSILLLEDVGELPYRIDRFLSQLRLAGKLDVLAGVVLGQFTDCDAPEGKPTLSLAEIFDGYFGGLGIPVLENFPTGHTPDNATLPLGVQVELDAETNRLTILENPVRLTKKVVA